MTSAAPALPAAAEASAAAHADARAIDSWLADAIAGRGAEWPAAWGEGVAAAAVERALYHGVAGLLAEQGEAIAGWPGALADAVRGQALAQGMWELRHRAELNRLLEALAEAEIAAALLKGSAIAYDLYPRPAARSRGDSDLLVAEADRASAQAVLEALGFAPSAPGGGASEPGALQQGWRRRCDDGSAHEIDLHWRVMNAPALRGVLGPDELLAARRPLPRLGPHGFAIGRGQMLLHCCAHRAMHITAPYIVEGRYYYGGDRLIWSKDIDLIAAALSPAEWDAFAADALRMGIGAVCGEALADASAALGTRVPTAVRERLAVDPASEPGSRYLLKSRQLARARSDLAAAGGARERLRYLWARAFPAGAFMRAKYPRHAGRPLPLLYARRMIELVRRRPTSGA